jgi:hypothetical protein
MSWRDLRKDDYFAFLNHNNPVEAVEGVAALLAASLHSTGIAHIEYLPHNATRYDIHIIRQMHDHRYLVAVPNFYSCFYFDLKQFLHPTYVGEKLQMNAGDAAPIAELIMAVGEALP